MSTSSGPARVNAYHHGDLRGALIEAGLAILAEAGDPAALSLREAARRAGVSAMAPYRHFPDKGALLAAIAGVGFQRLAAAQIEADAHDDPAAALTAQGIAYVAFARAEPALFRLMFGPAAAGKTGDLATAAARSYQVLAARVAGLVPPAEVGAATLRCWALSHGLAALAVDGQLDWQGEPAEVLVAQALRAPFALP